jgi:hypothetical protein
MCSDFDLIPEQIMAGVTLDDTVMRTGVILSADTGTEILALDEQSSNCFSFSGSGRMIWECTKQPVRVRDICVRLRQHYKVDEATCIVETLGYINALVAEKLLRLASPEAEL